MKELIPLAIPSTHNVRGLPVLDSHYDSADNCTQIGTYRGIDWKLKYAGYICSCAVPVEPHRTEEIRDYLKKRGIPYAERDDRFKIPWNVALELWETRWDDLNETYSMDDFYNYLEMGIGGIESMPFLLKREWMHATEQYSNFFTHADPMRGVTSEKGLLIHELTHAVYAANSWNGKLRFATLASIDTNFRSRAPHLQQINALTEAEAIARGLLQTFMSAKETNSPYQDSITDPYEFYMYVAQMLNTIPSLVNYGYSNLYTLDPHSAGAILLLQGKELTKFFTQTADTYYGEREELCSRICKKAIGVLENPEAVQTAVCDALPQIPPLVAQLIPRLDDEMRRIDPASLSYYAEKAVGDYQRILQIESQSA